MLITYHAAAESPSHERLQLLAHLSDRGASAKPSAADTGTSPDAEPGERKSFACRRSRCSAAALRGGVPRQAATRDSPIRAGYGVRAGQDGDLPGIVDTVNAASRSNDPTVCAQTEDKFRRTWAQLDSAQDTWVVTGPDGKIRGYGQVVPALPEERVFADAYTHPAHIGADSGGPDRHLIAPRPVCSPGPPAPGSGDAPGPDLAKYRQPRTDGCRSGAEW
jgi:hypothetical protein